MEDSTAVISQNDYQPELELKIQHYLQIIPLLDKNTIAATRVQEPDRADPYELEVWRREEIRRIRDGHFGMCPKMYFFHNYAQMWDIESGLIRPQYRQCQHEWFKLIEECQKSHEWGVICVKRRRIGASWLEAADVLHDCITSPMFKVGMTSKTKQDAIDLFKKVKFIYDNLPQWMRPSSAAGNTQTSIDFSYYVRDETGSRKKQGLQSEIVIKAPEETTWEGSALNKWVADECGKTNNLKGLYSMSNEVMRVGTRRVGIPLLFGTAGDIGKEGKDLKEMWYDSDVYKLKKFFFGGWQGLMVDKYGNDLVEETVRWIIYERKRRESLSGKEYNDFLQQYPLTVEEAFTSNEGQGLGNIIKINAQLNKLYETPVVEKKGYFRVNAAGQPYFVPDNRGACIIYEDPEPGIQNLYIAGNDPTDGEVEDTKNASSLSMFIMKKQGIAPPKIVFKYTDRPKIPRDYYEQALQALVYYNKTKVMIERNKMGMVTYFEERGYKHLLQTAPQGLNKVVTGFTWSIGVYMTKHVKQYMEALIEEYIEDYYEYIPAKSLLEELKKYGVVNTDEVYAFGMCLIFLKDDKTISKLSIEINKAIPNWDFRWQNGKLQRVKKADLQPKPPEK